MKPKELFGLAVRLLGLVFLYHGLMSVPTLFVAPPSVILLVIFLLAVAWWLIGGAALLTERAYPENAEEQTEAPTPATERKADV